MNEKHVEAIIAACSSNTAAIAESLNNCFDRQYRLESGASSLWSAGDVEGALDGPGLAVAFRIGQQGVLCLISESLPLPEWYKAPGESENSRLQTLSLEWSMNMLPADLEAEEYLATDSPNLKQQVIDAQPTEWATALELLVFDPSDAEADAGTDDDQPIAKLIVVTAVNQPPFPAEQGDSATDSNSASTASVDPVVSPAQATMPTAPVDRRMMKLPLKVSVRLAEKKIELGQLAAITPGGLVTFNKGSDSLLDLYVNNHLYGRGEAIKIGEKFGLKVTQVGVKQERQRRVL